MTFFEKLKEQSKSGLSLSILYGIFIWFIAYELYSISSYLNFNNSLTVYSVFYSLLSLFIQIILVFIFERKRKFFTSNLLLFAIFVPNEINRFLNLGSYSGFGQIIPIILNTAIAIYALLKIYAHKDDLKTYLPKPSQTIYIIILISLLKTYFDSSFSNMILYLMLFIVILLNADTIDTLLLGAYVYAMSLLRNIYTLFLIAGGNTRFEFDLVISIIINIVMLVFIVRTYLDLNRVNYI